MIQNGMEIGFHAVLKLWALFNERNKQTFKHFKHIEVKVKSLRKATVVCQKNCYLPSTLGNMFIRIFWNARLICDQIKTPPASPRNSVSLLQNSCLGRKVMFFDDFSQKASRMIFTMSNRANMLTLVFPPWDLSVQDTTSRTKFFRHCFI